MAYAPIRRCWLSWLVSPGFREPSVDEFTTKFVLDVNPDDVVEGFFFGGEAKLPRPPGFEIAWPAVDDTHDERIRLAPDPRRHILSCDPFQGRDLLTDGRRQAGHGEIAPRAGRGKIHDA